MNNKNTNAKGATRTTDSRNVRTIANNAGTTRSAGTAKTAGATRSAGTARSAGTTRTAGTTKTTTTNRSANANRGKKNTSINAKNSSKKKKKRMDDTVRKSFKHTSGFTFRLLVNLVIIFIVVSIFSYSFNFAYNVFSDVAKDPDSTHYVIVEIPADSSVINIGEALEDAGVIDNKYVFYVKTNLKKYSAKIQSGKYGLSPSMTYEEIAQIICDFSEDEEE